jgi:phosphatidylinositol alpha-mannosyltransferase
LRAYPHIKAAFPEVRFVIVGAGNWEESPYRAYIERHAMKDIVIVGRVSDADLPRYHRSAHVFCAPAVQGESFGIVLLEAMAAGLPIVASNIEGYSQVLTDGAEGFLVPPRDEKAVADSVCHLLEDRALAATMGERGLHTASLYSWQRIAEDVLDFYVKTGLRTLPSYAASIITASHMLM